MSALTRSERAFLRTFNTPEAQQLLLDSMPYNNRARYTCNSPPTALGEQTVHCLEGALVVAQIRLLHGQVPWVLDLRGVADDDHVVALFRYRGRWGAIGKSGHYGLEWREPKFTSVQALARSYASTYLNSRGECTLRSYAGPIDLRDLPDQSWRLRRGDLGVTMGDLLEAYPPQALLTEREALLLRVTARRARALQKEESELAVPERPTHI